MKRTLRIAAVVVLAALLFVLPVAAKAGGNVKGEVTAVGADSFTILSNKGETLTVNTPDGFDISTVEVGDYVLVRGELVEEGVINASTIKEVGGGDDDEGEGDETESEGEGSLADNSAFCAEGKQDKTHPMAASIAETYGMSEEEVSAYFCEGYSFGAIMLAAQTSDVLGGDVGSVLASRAVGKGWGQIWKDLKLVGRDGNGAAPPGQSSSNRPDDAGSGKPEDPGNPND